VAAYSMLRCSTEPTWCCTCIGNGSYKGQSVTLGQPCVRTSQTSATQRRSFSLGRYEFTEALPETLNLARCS
ncbi:hypothetical protein LSAT2_008845, partial [Lamellibrachia satsuma]